MHLLLWPKEIVVFFSMRVTQLLLLACVKAENEFNQFLSRLFTPESLTQYVISYDDKFEHKHGAHVAISTLNATHDYLNISVSLFVHPVAAHVNLLKGVFNHGWRILSQSISPATWHRVFVE